MDTKQTDANASQVVLPGTSGPLCEKRKCPTCWYFAIGSMMNPVSMQLREIVPIESHPAEIKDWELVFRGPGGMGSIEAKENATLYGVLHLLTETEMASLDKMEMSYRKVLCEASYGNGKTQKCCVYQVDPSKVPVDWKTMNAPPGERYIDIISQGAVHYKVSDKFVEWLKTVKTTPRKKPSEYRKVPAPKEDKKITAAELAKNDGAGTNELWMAINGKVCKWVGDLSKPGNVNMLEFTKRFAGKDGTVGMARGMYEPKFPIPTTLEAMPEEHRGLVEDNFCGFLMMRDPPLFQRIGTLVP